MDDYLAAWQRDALTYRGPVLHRLTWTLRRYLRSERKGKARGVSWGLFLVLRVPVSTELSSERWLVVTLYFLPFELTYHVRKKVSGFSWRNISNPRINMETMKPGPNRWTLIDLGESVA